MSERRRNGRHAKRALILCALGWMGASCFQAQPADLGGDPGPDGSAATNPDAASSGSPGADGAVKGDDAAPEGSTADARANDAAGDAADGATALLGCPAGSGDGPLGGSRPAALKVPSGYTASKSWPLVIELHGRGGTADAAEQYLQMGAMADKNGLFVIAPQGTLDSPPAGTQPASFWNATDGCCNLYGSTVDDVAYLRSLICHMRANYTINPNQVYIIGLSNGGFMAHRMACDAADLVTAIISVAGVTWKEPSRCKPANPVSVLHIHGTADATVAYDGSAAFAPGPTPSARATYDTWASLNHCTGDDVVGDPADLDQNVAGADTTPVSKPIVGSCTVATQLFTITGGTHAPNFSTATKQFFIDWFKATPANHP